MDKKTFINKMGFVDESVSSNIYDKLALAIKTNKTIYTSEFYTPNIWKAIENMSKELEIGVYTYGIFEEAERKVISFSNDTIWYYPVNLVKVECRSKFVRLQHKDYLGALMSLGLKREKFGDLILQEDHCYLAVHEEISDYIKMNLTSVGKCTCTVNVLDVDASEIPIYDFKTSLLNVSSMRIDCIVGSLCNISRSKAEELIRQGKVLVDYSPVDKKDKALADNCIITIRGYGKFKIVEEMGWTGSGRTKLLVKKFS